MSVHYQHVLDGIVISRGHSTHALAASVLIAVRAGGNPLYVSALAQRDDDLLVRFERLAGQIGSFVAYVCPAVVAVLLLEGANLLLDLVEHLGFRRQ